MRLPAHWTGNEAACSLGPGNEAACSLGPGNEAACSLGPGNEAACSLDNVKHRCGSLQLKALAK